MKYSNRLPAKTDAFFKRIDHILVGNYTLGNKGKRYLSLAFLLIACLIGFMTFSKTGIFRDKPYTLRPDFISTIFACLILSGLYVRRLFILGSSIYSLLLLTLNITLTAMLIQAPLGAGSSDFFKIPMNLVMFSAAIYAWTAIRQAAPLGWMAVGLIGLYNITKVSDAMGVWGYWFVILVGLAATLQILENLQGSTEDMRLAFFGVRRETDNARGLEGETRTHGKQAPDGPKI